MKLTFIFELLLIFILIGFAASAIVQRTNKVQNKITGINYKKIQLKKFHGNHRQNPANTTNRLCSCAVQTCKCCRNFNLQLLNIKGPGCASLQYLQGDQLAISMSFNERVLSNTTIKGTRPLPICMPLPGGISKFCGRVYNIKRTGSDFNACLGLELRSLNDLEAAIRVSCFSFGPKGFRLLPAQPLPVTEDEDDDDDDDDDDEYDFDDSDGTEIDFETLSVLDDDFVGSYFQESETPNKIQATTNKPARKVIKKTPQGVKPQLVVPLKGYTPKKTTTSRSLIVTPVISKNNLPSSTKTAITLQQTLTRIQSIITASTVRIQTTQKSKPENITTMEKFIATTEPQEITKNMLPESTNTEVTDPTVVNTDKPMESTTLPETTENIKLEEITPIATTETEVLQAESKGRIQKNFKDKNSQYGTVSTKSKENTKAKESANVSRMSRKAYFETAGIFLNKISRAVNSRLMLYALV